MSLSLFYIPFPIVILLVVGLIYTVYKVVSSKLVSEKRNYILKYLIYIALLPLFNWVLSPFIFSSIVPRVVLISCVIIFGAIEIWRIRTYLSFVHFTLIFFIFLGVLLSFVYDKALIVLNLFNCVFIFDGMSQIGGQLLGKTKLAPKISPNKTWEGFIVGLCTAVLVMQFIDNTTPSPYNKLGYFSSLHYVTICIWAVLGDLYFSKLKRKAGIKDYANYLPGHGGLLDRFDGILFAYAFCFYTSLIFYKL